MQHHHARQSPPTVVYRPHSAPPCRGRWRALVPDTIRQMNGQFRGPVSLRAVALCAVAVIKAARVADHLCRRLTCWVVAVRRLPIFLLLHLRLIRRRCAAEDSFSHLFVSAVACRCVIRLVYFSVSRYNWPNTRAHFANKQPIRHFNHFAQSRPAVGVCRTETSSSHPIPRPRRTWRRTGTVCHSLPPAESPREP